MAIRSRDKLAKKRSIKGYLKQAESNKLLELLSKVAKNGANRPPIAKSSGH